MMGRLRFVVAAIVSPAFDSRSRAVRAAIEATLGYTLILITVWSPHSFRHYVGLAAAFWIFGVMLLDGQAEESSDLGIRALWRCSWAVAIALALSACTVMLAAYLGTLHFHSGPVAGRAPMMGYMLWSVLQQIILQQFLMTRLLVLFRKPRPAVLMAALLFALAHVPNPLLTAVTVLWGVTSCWLYLRYRSLIAVAAIHFILGATLADCVPATIHGNMRVGLGYLNYHAHSPRAQALVPLATATPALRPDNAAGGRHE